MTLFQLIMLGISAFFAYQVYQHIQTLQDPIKEQEDGRSKDAFSPFDAEVLVAKADEAMEVGDLQKALAIYKEADIKAPKNPETLFKMGYVLAQQDRDDEALEYYQEALSLDEQNTYIHQALASLYRKMKAYEKAQEHIKRSLEIDDKNPITYFNYGNLLQDMGEKQKAKEMYKKALELDSTLDAAKEELEKLEEMA